MVGKGARSRTWPHIAAHLRGLARIGAHGGAWGAWGRTMAVGRVEGGRVRGDMGQVTGEKGGETRIEPGRRPGWHRQDGVRLSMGERVRRDYPLSRTNCGCWKKGLNWRRKVGRVQSSRFKVGGRRDPPLPRLPPSPRLRRTGRWTGTNCHELPRMEKARRGRKGLNRR